MNVRCRPTSEKTVAPPSNGRTATGTPGSSSTATKFDQLLRNSSQPSGKAVGPMTVSSSGYAILQDGSQVNALSTASTTRGSSQSPRRCGRRTGRKPHQDTRTACLRDDWAMTTSSCRAVLVDTPRSGADATSQTGRDDNRLVSVSAFALFAGCSL